MIGAIPGYSLKQSDMIIKMNFKKISLNRAMLWIKHSNTLQGYFTI